MKRLLLTSVLGILVVGLMASCASMQGKKAEKRGKKAEAKAEKVEKKAEAKAEKAEAKAEKAAKEAEAKAEAAGGLQKVESSVIEAVGYDAAAQDLTIVMAKTGETYVYHKVPEKVYKKLMAADSKGKFFAKNIKEKYEFTKK
jgi:regulator of protease activity HflC (stomatin/prohibitin superfamily)